MVSKTETVRREIVKIVIEWAYDDDDFMQDATEWLDCQAVVKKNGGVDVQGTYENIMEEGGCTPEQARQQTAAFIARWDAYKRDDWAYLGCKACAIEECRNANTEELISTQEVAHSSVWGIESFCGEEYRNEIELDQIAETIAELVKQGYGTKEELNALPVEESKNSYPPSGYDYGKTAKPLGILPQDTDNTKYHYAEDHEELDNYPFDNAEEGQVVAVCYECGYTMLPEDIDNKEKHSEYCVLFEEEETE